jgi:NNP family nitrate/nitrite transporter-like MFS transporter
LFLATTVLWLGVALAPPWAAAGTLLFLTTGALGMGNGAVFQLVPNRFGQQVGVVTGVVGAAGGVGGFILPTLLGSMRQWTGSYGVGFVLLAASALAAAIAIAVRGRAWSVLPVSETIRAS